MLLFLRKCNRSMEEISTELETKLSLRNIDSDLTPGPGHYKWDPHCPQFIVLHPSTRSILSQSALVRKHKLILQVENRFKK